MYNDYYKDFLHSQAYCNVENDIFYLNLRKILIHNLTEQIFLDVEELLHAEILFKLEFGFQHGFKYGCDRAGE